MKSFIVCLLVLCSNRVLGHFPDAYEFCMGVLNRETSPTQQCDPSSCQGRPGKRGPAGNMGPKGDKGEIGDETELRGQIQQLEDKVNLLQKLMPIDAKIEYCGLGMKDRTILDSAITASSELDSNAVARFGRLDNQKQGSIRGAWFPKTNRVGEWMQVDLGSEKLVLGVITQGRPRDYNQFVTSYKVSCGNRSGAFQVILQNGVEKVFSGNKDTESKVTNVFPEPLWCRYIRIFPQTWNGYTSVRLEILRGECAGFF